MHFGIQLAMNCFKFALCSAVGRNPQFDSIDGNYIPDSYKNTASFARKAMEKNILPYRIFTTKHCSLFSTLRKHEKYSKSIWRNHFFLDNVQMFYSLQIFTCTVFAVHPITPPTFSSVWIRSDIVHLWVVIIFSLKMHSTSRFLSITCCSKLLFRSIVLKKKIQH